LEIYSIGLAGRTAESFFEDLARARIKVVLDVRLRNTSQISGFAKSRDLPFFLHRLVGAAYIHEPRLAPSADLLDAYRHKSLSWDEYEVAFRSLMEERRAELAVDRSLFKQEVCLMCSEFEPKRCHRRLVIEYLNEKWGNVVARHL
jgi:uncharacterized protein (DUF488 family)